MEVGEGRVHLNKGSKRFSDGRTSCQVAVGICRHIYIVSPDFVKNRQNRPIVFVQISFSDEDKDWVRLLIEVGCYTIGIVLSSWSVKFLAVNGPRPHSHIPDEDTPGALGKKHPATSAEQCSRL